MQVLILIHVHCPFLKKTKHTTKYIKHVFLSFICKLVTCHPTALPPSCRANSHRSPWLGFRTPGNTVQYCITHLVSSPGLFVMIWACQGSLTGSASVNTCPFHCSEETKVNAFDHGDISEWNEEEMERWQLGQIASKIEHDKPLIVISMWTLREWSVYDDREYEWIWNSFERREVEGNWPKGVFSVWGINLVYPNLGHIFIVLAFIARGHNNIVRIKLIAGIWECGNITRKNFDGEPRAIRRPYVQKG